MTQFGPRIEPIISPTPNYSRRFVGLPCIQVEMLVAWIPRVGPADCGQGISLQKIFSILRRGAQTRKINFADLFSGKKNCELELEAFVRKET